MINPINSFPHRLGGADGIPNPPWNDSNDCNAAAQDSTACSDDSTATDEHHEPSYQVLSFLAQSPHDDGSLHGRLVGIHPAADLERHRTVFYMVRAQRLLDDLLALPQ